MFRIAYEISESEIERGIHVHHATVVRILEHGRNQFLEQLGCPESWFVSQDLLPVIYTLSVRYLRELFLEKVAITCEHGKINDKSIIIEQSIFNHKDKKAVEAKVECKVLSLTGRRAVLPPAKFCQAFYKVFP